MDETSDRRTETAVLWVRSLNPDGAGPRRDRAIARLRDLADRGRLDDATVRLWGKRIRPGTAAARTDHGARILDRVERFRSWARREGYSLRPFVQDRARDGRTELLLPTMALAEYAGGELRFVSPCANAEEGHTVFDRIEALDDGDGSGRDEPGDWTSPLVANPQP